jgi:hypothetical protein
LVGIGCGVGAEVDPCQQYDSEGRSGENNLKRQQHQIIPWSELPMTRGIENMKPKNTICLWYDKDALEAARFYAATFSG